MLSVLTDDSTHFSHIFISPLWRLATCILTFLYQSLDTFEMSVPFKHCVLPRHHHKRLFKQFVSLISCFLKLQIILDANFLVLRSANSLDYSDYKMHWTQRHLNDNCTIQHSVIAALVTLIHNTSTQWHLAAYSCPIQYLISMPCGQSRNFPPHF